MIALFKKDFSQFFLNSSGLVVLCLFLIVNSLILWVLPNPYNILEGAYADLSMFFEIAPLLFALLIPIISQKIIGEEKRSGTLELIQALPLSWKQIIYTKNLSILALCLLAISPFGIYILSVMQLGKIDLGVLLASGLGLIGVICVFISLDAAIQLKIKNSISALLISILANTTLYVGLEWIYPQWGLFDQFEQVSRGVITFQNAIYFVGLILVFNSISTRQINWKTYSIFLIALSASIWYNPQMDFTADKRYSVKPITESTLTKVNEELEISIYLDGEFPVEFKRLQTELLTLLAQYRKINNNIRFDLINPEGQFQNLIERGMEVSNLSIEKNGILSEQFIVPYLSMSYKGKERVVNLLKDSPSSNQIEESVQNLEYALTKNIYELTQTKKKKIAVLSGNKQSPDILIYDLLSSLGSRYRLAKFTLDSVATNPQKTLEDLTQYDLVINSNPKESFTESEKYVLDQYQYQGGNSLWMLNAVNMSLDSLIRDGQSLSFPSNLNLEDLLFSFGVRIQPSLIKDLYASKIPMATGKVGNQTQYQLVNWPYHILSRGNPEQAIGTNLSYIQLKFASPIEVLENNTLSTEILLSSSKQSQIQKAPNLIYLEDLLNEDPRNYKQGPLNTAVLINGTFESAYAIRTKPFKSKNREQKPGKLILISDGEIAENGIQEKQPTRLGTDPYGGGEFDNKTFLTNAIDYLCGLENLIQLRDRKINLFPLDQAKAFNESLQFRLANTILPLALFLVLNFCYRRYYRNKHQ